MERITFAQNQFIVPLRPTIGFIEGDGIGRDITPVALRVIDAAVAKAYNEKRQIAWKEVLMGEKALKATKSYLPEESLALIRDLRLALKGPLTTPIGGGHRSINVTLRQKLDLYSCIRPVRYIKGLPSPLRHPERVNMVLFRENTEDVYAGIEWKSQSNDAQEIIALLHKKGYAVAQDAGIGVKPISKKNSERLVEAAMQYAQKHRRSTLTLVHKGNIMKFTEGAFKEWGFHILREKYRDAIIFEDELAGAKPKNKILVNDRLADAMFQQVLLRPDEYEVIATTNLNGDYLSDALAAQIGGLGVAPGANIGDGIAVFEATHGSAPKHAGQDKANPSSLLLSGALMLEYMGWFEAANALYAGLEKTYLKKSVTYDLARQLEGSHEVTCSKFGELVIANL